MILKTAVSNAVINKIRQSSESDSEAKSLMARLFRSVGLRPPSRKMQSTDAWEAQKKTLRSKIKADENVPDIAPFGSPEWRQAVKDINSGNTRRLYSGMSAGQASSIQQFGPSTPMTTSREPGASKWHEQIEGVLKKYEDNPNIWDRINSARTHGIFTVDDPKSRALDYYARRASYDTDPPTIHSFELPASMLRPTGHDEEVRIPRSMYTRWSRNHKNTILG